MNPITLTHGATASNNGRRFEEATNSKPRLIAMGFIPINGGQYLEKTHDDNRNYVFLQQTNLRVYMKLRHPNAKVYRNPDECFIVEHIDGTCHVKILEKKAQNVNGTVETKLWAAPALKREFELLLGPNITISYAFCVNTFIKSYLLSSHPKYVALNQILQENNIEVFCGDDTDYFDRLDAWAWF